MNVYVRSEQNTGYRSDIQAYRAIAVIAVILYHAGGLLPGGFFGVDVFFVISGYVICQLVIREIRLSKNYKFEIGQFFFRRFKRLAPPLGNNCCFIDSFNISNITYWATIGLRKNRFICSSFYIKCFYRSRVRELFHRRGIPKYISTHVVTGCRGTILYYICSFYIFILT